MCFVLFIFLWMRHFMGLERHSAWWLYFNVSDVSHSFLCFHHIHDKKMPFIIIKCYITCWKHYFHQHFFILTNKRHSHSSSKNVFPFFCIKRCHHFALGFTMQSIHNIFVQLWNEKSSLTMHWIGYAKQLFVFQTHLQNNHPFCTIKNATNYN